LGSARTSDHTKRARDVYRYDRDYRGRAVSMGVEKQMAGHEHSHEHKIKVGVEQALNEWVLAEERTQRESVKVVTRGVV
jgi:hypothetical protein